MVAKQIAQLDVPDAVRSALITGAGAAIGAATGGTAGAATAFNATANNYLQHSTNWRSSQWGAFNVSKDFFEFIRKNAVLEEFSQENPFAPILVDKTYLCRQDFKSGYRIGRIFLPAP